MRMENNLTPITWRLLFGEDLEELPDPNRPENIPVIQAKQREETERLKAFVEGVAKPLWSQWGKKVKRDTLAVISNPEVDKCSCDVCLKIREIRSIFYLLIEAEKILIKEGAK